MRYLSLPAWRDGRPLYLAEIILALGWSAADLTWRCRDLEIGPGPDVSALEEVALSDKKLSTLELLHFATPDVQLIEGEVFAYRKERGTGQPIVTIRAVDSTSWDLEFFNDHDFQSIITAFPESIELEAKLFEN